MAPVIMGHKHTKQKEIAAVNACYMPLNGAPITYERKYLDKLHITTPNKYLLTIKNNSLLQVAFDRKISYRKQMVVDSDIWDEILSCEEHYNDVNRRASIIVSHFDQTHNHVIFGNCEIIFDTIIDPNTLRQVYINY